MSLLLGLRMALTGGRESVARMVLMTIGIAVGMLLLLLSLTGLPARQTHIDRLAWHRTTGQSPPTAPDGAWWVAVTDRYAGQDVIRVNVAALGPRPPVPPGVRRLPGPGEVVLSPALAELVRNVPDDQLRDRFPGRVIGTIGDEGLIGPAELVGIVGRTPEEMENIHGALEIRGIEQPGEPLDLYELVGIMHGIVAMLIVGPVMVFVWVCTRIGGVRREQRFAAIRLAGASRWQIAALAAIETAAATLTGILLGWLGFQVSRPIVAGQMTLGHSASIFPQDLAVPAWQVILAMSAVMALSLGTTLVALRPAQITPLGVRQRARKRPPRLWRLAPLAAGMLGLWYSSQASLDQANGITTPLVAAVSLFSPLSILVGLVLAGPLVCLWVGRGLARLSGGVATVIVANRIAVDPYSTFRAVSGSAVAMFVATLLGMIPAYGGLISPTAEDGRSVLNEGVVAVHVQGAPEESLAPLLRHDGVVVARLGAGDRIVVACAELVRLAVLNCPLPANLGDGRDETSERMKSEQLFSLPFFQASSADHIFNPQGFAEPGPDFARQPIQT
ncbi:MAG TPA: FtsX-like permease family protein, partial [Candidatus Limnocylindrales bacterium]|nr:FtsX-like permease family protein [Candidatus Limnocylindrales bacterium]